MKDKHKIVFYGEIAEGQDLETVKKNLSVLFKTDLDKIDGLLSKPSVLIRKDIDFQTASRYQEILKKAGAICKVEPMISEQKRIPVSARSDESQAKYEVIYYGELVEGEDLTTVVKKLASLFKTDISKIDKFLSHLPAIIKKDVDLDTASRYREAIKKAGAICLIKPIISTQRAIPVLPKSEKISMSVPASPPPPQTDNAPLQTQTDNAPPSPQADNAPPQIHVDDVPPPPQTDNAPLQTQTDNIPLRTRTDNAPPSPKPVMPQQSSSESVVLQETQSGLSDLSGSENKASDPSAQDRTEEVQASGQIQLPSHHLVCPKCNFEQESSDKCVRCGLTLQDPCKLMAQTPSPQSNDSERLSDTGIAQSQEHQSGQHSETFFKSLFHLNQEERKEIQRLIIGSAIIGAIVGFMWGGLYDPWGNRGFAAAIINFLLFGGWGLAEASGLIVARNFGHAKSRKRLIFNGALWGGIWVSIFTALEMVTNLSSLVPGFSRIILGLITGFIIGGLISAICTIKLSGIMRIHEKEAVDGLKADGKFDSLKADEKFDSLKADEKFDSLKAGEKDTTQKGLSIVWKVVMVFGIGCLLFILVMLLTVGFFVNEAAIEFKKIKKENGYNSSYMKEDALKSADIKLDKPVKCTPSEAPLNALLQERYISSELKNLTCLDLSFTQVSDLSSLRDYENLTSLNLTCTPVRDLSPLKGLKKLSKINLSFTQINDLTPLKEHQNLSLDFSNCQISDLSFLKDLENINALSLSFTQVRDLNPLRNLKNLSSLDLWNTPVSDLSPIDCLENLSSLNLWKTHVNDLSPLRDLKKLSILNLRNTPVSDLSPIKDLENLFSLDLSQTSVNDLSPLMDLENLYSLQLWDTPVSDLTPLEGLEGLSKLYLWSTEVSDLSPLKNLKKLSYLDLSKNQVSEEQIMALKEAIPGIEIKLHDIRMEEIMGRFSLNKKYE